MRYLLSRDNYHEVLHSSHASARQVRAQGASGCHGSGSRSPAGFTLQGGGASGGAPCLRWSSSGVEHVHGKHGVTGSIPVSSFVGSPASTILRLGSRPLPAALAQDRPERPSTRWRSLRTVPSAVEGRCGASRRTTYVRRIPPVVSFVIMRTVGPADFSPRCFASRNKLAGVEI